jgi:uncharacterized protein with GYD domain
MHQWTYKNDHVRFMLLEKKERSEVVKTAIEAFGGSLQAFYYCFGQYDALAISDFPDGQSALACSMYVVAQGRIEHVHTTALFSADEGLGAMLQAGKMAGPDPGH